MQAESPVAGQGERAGAPPGSGPTAARTWVQSLAVGAAALAIFLVTLDAPGLVWDEPPGIQRQHAIHDWVGKLLGRTWRADAFSADGQAYPCTCHACEAGTHSEAKPFQREALELGWPFAREAPHEHPPVYAILSYVTWRLTEWLWGPLCAHRAATAVMFAVMAGVLFHVVRQRCSALAAWAAVAALVANPRLFADAHLATTDVIMASFWFLAAAAFLPTCETGRHPWAFGLLAGLALMSKLTGGLLLIPAAVWGAIYARKQAVRMFLWSIPIIPVVMVLVHPAWWPVWNDPWRPAEGIARWYRALVHHDQRVPVYFLGRVYDYRAAFLPWHNAGTLTAMTMPLGLLTPAVLGMAAAFRNIGVQLVSRRRSVSPNAFAAWALLNFLTLIVLRAFPWMPGHDGIRQIVAAFPFFAVLVGYGVFVLQRSMQAPNAGAKRPRLPPAIGAWVPLAAAIVGIGSAAFQSARLHPFGLSYYSELSGGAAGAHSLGMETTYYWDAATHEVLDWMNRNLPEGGTLLIAPPPDVRTFEWLQRWGRLRADLRPLQWEPSRWALAKPPDGYVILLMRQGLVQRDPILRRLSAREAQDELKPSVLGVRLLAVFPPDDVRKAWREVQF